MRFDGGFFRFLIRRGRWHLENLWGTYSASCQAPGIEIRQGVTIINPALFECGPGMRIESGCFLHCGGNSWSNGRGRIRFGSHCWLSQNNVIYGAGEVLVGDYVGTGPGVLIFSSRDDYSLEYAREPSIVHQFGTVVIDSYVRIFSGAIIGPGVHIGEGAVVGANSVVLKDVPAWTVVAGSPARVIGPRGRDRSLGDRKSTQSETGHE